MTTATPRSMTRRLAVLPFTARKAKAKRVPKASDYLMTPVTRTIVSLACFTMTFVCLYALARAAMGQVADLSAYAKLPVWIHVAAVLPAVPLGGYLLLAKKGTARHKQLGKVWLVLMLVTATSAIFIKTKAGSARSTSSCRLPSTPHGKWWRRRGAAILRRTSGTWSAPICSR